MNARRSAISCVVLGLAFAGAILLGGCASNSGVVPIGKDTFTVTKQAATGFSGTGTLKAEAFQEASRYCDQTGKSLQVVSTHEASPPFILGNFPKAEVQFMCLDSKDAELGRPKLKKSPDKIIEVKDGRAPSREVSNSKDLYSDLTKLDDLRKRGILSESEFEAQKKKLLAN